MRGIARGVEAGALLVPSRGGGLAATVAVAAIIILIVRIIEVVAAAKLFGLAKDVARFGSLPFVRGDEFLCSSLPAAVWKADDPVEDVDDAACCFGCHCVLV